MAVLAGRDSFTADEHLTQSGNVFAFSELADLGHLAVKFAAAFGCEVIAVTSSERKFEQARGFGASGVLTGSDSTALQNMESTTQKEIRNESRSIRAISFIGLSIAVATVLTLAGEDKYSLKVPGGLAFSEFRGYESWQMISMSRTEEAVAVTLGNPVMIGAYQAGIPANGKPVPDGARMAKIHWTPKKNELFPTATVPGALLNVDFMVKDSKRFSDSGGWGYAVFDFDAASNTFKPGTLASKPPQASDAKCGYACHTAVKKKDYVFTEYGKR